MIKQKRNILIALLVVIGLLVFFANGFASDIIVRVKIDKAVYRVGERMDITLEVENSTDYAILPDITPTQREPNKGGCLTYKIFRDKWGPHNAIIFELAGSDYLMPVLTQYSKYYRPPVIEPNSTITVGRGYLIIQPQENYPYENFYIMKVHFSGKSNGKDVDGYASVTYKVEG